MSSLDILTDAGKRTIEQERLAAAIIEQQWRDCHYVMTGKNGIAVVDALILRHEHIAAIVETKCRTMTLAQLRGSFKNEWLVTFDKILGGVEVAKGLAVPYWGLLYLVPDNIVLRVKIFDPIFGWLAQLRIERTETQRTVNGGKAVRSNAYINMASADVLRPAEETA